MTQTDYATKAALTEFIVRHAYALDSEDYETLATLYAPDVTGTFQGHGPVSGYDAMEAIYRHSSRNLAAQQHILSNHLIEISGDEATSRCYFHAMHFRPGAPGGETFIVGGTYTDALRRSGDQWRIVQHDISYGWTSGNPSVMDD